MPAEAPVVAPHSLAADLARAPPRHELRGARRDREHLGEGGVRLRVLHDVGRPERHGTRATQRGLRRATSTSRESRLVRRRVVCRLHAHRGTHRERRLVELRLLPGREEHEAEGRDPERQAEQQNRGGRALRAATDLPRRERRDASPGSGTDALEDAGCRGDEPHADEGRGGEGECRADDEHRVDGERRGRLHRRAVRLQLPERDGREGDEGDIHPGVHETGCRPLTPLGLLTLNERALLAPQRRHEHDDEDDRDCRGYQPRGGRYPHRGRHTGGAHRRLQGDGAVDEPSERRRHRADHHGQHARLEQREQEDLGAGRPSRPQQLALARARIHEESRHLAERRDGQHREQEAHDDHGRAGHHEPRGDPAHRLRDLRVVEDLARHRSRVERDVGVGVRQPLQQRLQAVDRDGREVGGDREVEERQRHARRVESARGADERAERGDLPVEPHARIGEGGIEPAPGEPVRRPVGALDVVDAVEADHARRDLRCAGGDGDGAAHPDRQSRCGGGREGDVDRPVALGGDRSSPLPRGERRVGGDPVELAEVGERRLLRLPSDRLESRQRLARGGRGHPVAENRAGRGDHALPRLVEGHGRVEEAHVQRGLRLGKSDERAANAALLGRRDEEAQRRDEHARESGDGRHGEEEPPLRPRAADRRTHEKGSRSRRDPAGRTRCRA
jgi:hypothetical protein